MICFLKMLLHSFNFVGSQAVAVFQKITRHAAILMIITTVFLSGCVTIDNRFTKLAPGKWRGIFRLEESTVTPNPKGAPQEEKMNFRFDEATNGELPFQMEVRYTNPETFEIDFINGEERVKVESQDIIYVRGKGTDRDTITINFPIYGTKMVGVVQERMIDANFYNAKGMATQVLIRQGDDYRFSTLSKPPVMDLSGEWETTFGVFDSVQDKAVGEFRQKGNRLSGTFRTETGDYRFLDGEVQADKMYLSAFDGTHVYLFEGKIKGDSILGIFRAGKSYKTAWTARRNANFKLRAADSLTFLKPGYPKFDFNFKTLEGKSVSPNAPEYAGKVRVVTIMGTWCPNCRDETAFLVEYLQKNKDLAVIGLAFERSAEAAAKQIPLYRDRMKVPFPVLIASTTTAKDEAAKALPMLNAIIGYPTMIVLDKKGAVRKIHTGFDGPATSKYGAFQQEFDALIKKLQAEP